MNECRHPAERQHRYWDLSDRTTPVGIECTACGGIWFRNKDGRYERPNTTMAKEYEFMKKKGTELCREALTQLKARECQGKGTEPVDEKEMLRQLAGPPPLWSHPWVAEDIPNARWKYEIKCGQAVYAEAFGFAIAEYIAAISPSVIRRFLDEFDQEVEARLKAEARIAELERQLNDLTSARSV